MNLLNAVSEYLTPEIVKKAASYMGEPEELVRKGLDLIVPSALAGISGKADAGDKLGLADLAKQAYDSGVLSSLADAFTPGGPGVSDAAPKLITGVFDNKYGAVANMISSITGLKGSSISNLFGSVVPLVLALLGRHAKEHQATPDDLVSLVESQKSRFLSLLPVNFPLQPKQTVQQDSHVHAISTEEVSPYSRLLPVFAAILTMLMLWLILRMCNVHTADQKMAVVETKKESLPEMPEAAAPSVPNIREAFKVVLPNGVELNAFKGGIEDQLIAFLNDPKAEPGKDVWFDFNDLNFTFGTAQIIPESKKEVENIHEILKAYPKAIIKLGGYTDKVGDEAANKKLSQDRADAVASLLKEMGVGAQVAGAEGYGSAFAKFPADAPESERIRDRRVSVSVRAK